MKKTYLIFLILFPVGIFAQSFPVAVDDTAQVMNQQLVKIYPLLNDYDPDGDTIEITYLSSFSHGEHWHEDSIVYYKSEWFEGWEDLRYRVSKVGNPSYQSEKAHIQIEVITNPDVPVAQQDTFIAKYLEPTTLDVLLNDYDPNEDEIIIDSILYAYYCSVEISSDSTQLTFTSEYSPYGRSSFGYRIVEKNTAENYYSNSCYVRVHLQKNEELPIAVYDSVSATGGILTSFEVISNDLNPLNETLEIIEVTEPSHGEFSFDDSLIYYRPSLSYTGTDQVEYIIRYKNKPWLYSQEGNVNININKNPNCPIGLPDYGSGMAFTEIPVEVISNDYDPNGDPIEVFEVKTNHFLGLGEISFQGDSVLYTPPASINGLDKAYYKIRKANDPLYYSEWIPIHYNIVHNPIFPITNPDSATTYAGMEVSLNFRKNDIIPDSTEIPKVMIFANQNIGRLNGYTDSTLNYIPYKISYGRDTINYHFINYGHPAVVLATGEVYIDIINNRSYDSLDINNISAGINSNLALFSKHFETPGWGPSYYESHFESPKYSGKNTIFLNKIWIGGVDESGSLHMAAERYRQYGRDYQPGPISNNYDSALLVDWQRTWKLNKEEVDYHRNNWWKEYYEPIENIDKWPGNGDIAYGMPSKLAPYFDHDGNGIYDPAFGDYPLIRGDQCIFFMANDDITHTESGGDSLLVEIHCMAYAYDAQEDSILKNTIFVHYDLINRSENTYYDTYFGVFTDFALGYDWDDFVGSHVMGNSFFAYNGYNIDGGYDPKYYGEHPPAQSVTILAGPYIDPDALDNPVGGCDYSINGVNFNNGIVDDERYGLTCFLYLNDGPGYISDPQTADEYYQRMQGYWLDTMQVVFGGWGFNWYNGNVRTPCRYMFPGNTDPMNWGTDCVLPYGGYNQNGKWWTEEDEGNYPDDRRGMGSSGPFTFRPGDVQEVDMAYVFANSYYNADSSKNLLIERLYELRQRVLDGEIIVPNEELDINDLKISQSSFNVYPNPARQMIYLVQDDFEISNMEYRIVNTMGTIMQSGKLSPKTPNEIKVSSLKPGLYIISVFTEEGLSTQKFIKY